MDTERRILPFYKAYPGSFTAGSYLPTPYNREREEEMIRDLDYFSQMYPAKVRFYQQRIAGILDKMDYEGSMIYDEYPDRFSLERLAKSIQQVIAREEASQEQSKTQEESEFPLLFVLLNVEVYKRRHGGPRGFYHLG